MQPPFVSTSEFSIAAGAACLDGHFPDMPIVPGVVMLGHVIAAATARHRGHAAGIARCKFLAPLYPGDTCHIDLGQPESGRLSFVCRRADAVLARGALFWEAADG